MKLRDVAAVIRSKNSGPFELTFDIIFKDGDLFQRVYEAGVITRELFAKLYNLPVENVTAVIGFSPANAIKATLVRPIPSGALGERDVYGAQQHVPLFDVEIQL